jgi:hypothetical protein
MKTDLVILAAVATIVGILFVNSSSTSLFAEGTGVTPAVSPNIIQVIIEAIQKTEPWLQPVETIYITPKTGSQGGVVYDARLMFLDTRGFFGTQYDLTASVSPAGAVTILSKASSSSPDRSGPFQSYAPDKYQPFADVQSDLNQQLADVIKASRELPPKQVQF